MIQLAICGQSLLSTVLLLIIFMVLYILYITPKIQEYKDLKVYKNRDWKYKRKEIIIISVVFGLILLVLAILPLFLIDAPQYIS